VYREREISLADNFMAFDCDCYCLIGFRNSWKTYPQVLGTDSLCSTNYFYVRIEYLVFCNVL
jgi:hypothetical protein